MPSFTSFVRRRESSHLDEQDQKDVGTKDGKLQRRHTKRDFLRSLLTRSSNHSSSSRHSGQFAGPTNIVPHPSSSTTSPEKPASPLSNSNKPLPAPPAPGTELEPTPTVRPAKKLQRIISPISPSDLHKLFSGAPQFFARSEGHHTGAPHPSVAFPWNEEVEIRDLSDHQQIRDAAWSSVSAWPHITRDVSKTLEGIKKHHEQQRAHFLPRCRERPNMLSMQGLERGTIGFQAALEIDVADATQTPEGGLGDTVTNTLQDRREEFLKAKDGLRPIPESKLVERLMSASTAYHEDPADQHRPTIELYTELFTQILFPPSRVTEHDDPYSLPVQIEVLIDVLGAPGIWFDFSLVEWRIRLGSVLWNAPLEDDIVVNNEVEQDLGEQKYWLLLQILLACELLRRLDAMSANIYHGNEAPSPHEFQRFNKKTSASVRWSLILARYWLENIKIEKITHEAVSKKVAATSWLSKMRGAPSTEEHEADDTLNNVQFYGRHQTRQLNGLVHFARKLNWPNIDLIAMKISASGIKIPDSSQVTPAGTPRSMSTQRSSSYFSNRPSIRRVFSRQRMSAMVHPSGWLSNSYISGLILPGEGLSHFLISTLLENDEEALSKLGEEANLYGGFSYGNKSFWSSSCIVGRVLAAGKSAECMGWISSDVIPRGVGESWVNIDVDFAPQFDGDNEAKPRIWHKTAIETAGHVLGGADSSSVLPGDFIIPSDESTQQPLSIKLESLDLFAAIESVHSTTPMTESLTPLSDATEPAGIQNYSAMMRFSVDADGEGKKEVDLPLSNDVFFVTAFPCVSSSHMDLLRSPTSPSFQIPDKNLSGLSKTLLAHPLHKSFTFTKLPLSTVLKLPANLPFTSLLSPPQSPTDEPTQSTTHTTNSPIPKILVIDCTDSTMIAFPISVGRGRSSGNDTEMIARAICAERGWHALISRRGRGCLSCSVREASALGWRVILRFA